MVGNPKGEVKAKSIFRSLGVDGISSKTLRKSSQGMFVIDVSNLQNTITNYGFWGAPKGDFASCTWPADPGDNRFLYQGGLWIGGKIGSKTITVVTTFTDSPLTCLTF